MDQLLEIHSVPIVIKYNVNREPVEKDMTANVEVSKNDNDNVVSMKSQSIQVNLDSMRNESGKGDTDEYTASDGRSDEYSANAIFTDNGEISVDYQKILNQTSRHKVSAPKSDINLDQLNVQYEMDKVNFNFKMADSKVEFTPADLEFTIEQRPEVVVKYIGGPIYVPPSSDPNYEPEVDVKA